MKNLSVTSIIFVAAAVLGTGVMSQSDSLTATLLEEILSMKDEINALELRVHDLENSGSCGSSSASGGSSSNDTMTVCDFLVNVFPILNFFSTVAKSKLIQ